MRFLDTEIPGVVVVDPERIEDERGFFARTWDEGEFEEHGLSPNLVQCSVSWNRAKRTLRGLHYQTAPHQETKLVRCTSGAIFDVAVDLRRESRTFLRWVGVELTAENRRALYVPEGCAHGFLTLLDGTEVSYQMSERFAPEAARGARWDDPAIGIDWPAPPSEMNERDRSWPDLVSAEVAR